jgi:hypothetical protein
MSDSGALAKLGRIAARGHVAREAPACGLIGTRARVLRGCDLVQHGTVHVEKVVGTAKPSFLRVCPQG